MVFSSRNHIKDGLFFLHGFIFGLSVENLIPNINKAVIDETSLFDYSEDNVSVWRLVFLFTLRDTV